MEDTSRETIRGKQYDLVFACSGACDVGLIADGAARLLTEERIASMCCIAAIGAGVPDIVEKAQAARRMVAIDGCSSECSRKILEKAGFEGFAHIQLESFGMEKGKTPAGREKMQRVKGLAALELAPGAGRPPGCCCS